MSFSYEVRNRSIIVSLEKEIDHHNAKEIIRKLDRLIELNNIKTLVLDFSDVTFMDSSGIGVILGRYKNMKNMGGEIGIVNVNEHVNKLLKLSGIYRIIKHFVSIEEAISILS
jgi:stage II sporulation protein AA (anti-sigma F factor antagonist)